MPKTIQQILQGNNQALKKALFQFSTKDDSKRVILKFNLWARYYFSNYFTSKDAKFHKDIDEYNLQSYRGTIDSFTDIVFRGGAKTTRTKLFTAYVILNDTDHFRRYIKILTADNKNSQQIVTDVYNMLISTLDLYPEVFEKTVTKREETMSSFTTSTGVKLTAGTVGTSQRGDIQEASRPDWIIYDDFEDRTTIRSAVKTIAIWDNMEEARLGLSKRGACIYNCNYISEAGNVHKLVNKEDSKNIVLVTPILKDNKSTWSRYTLEEIEQMKKNDDDFEGERMCEPSAGKDVYFDRSILDEMKVREFTKSVDFKQFYKFDPSHRYGSGHDVAKGIGLDSSTSVFIDFETVPARVVATFHSNLINPETFGDEIYRQQELYPGSIAGIENNFGTDAILRMKQLGGSLYTTEKNDKSIVDKVHTDFGWNTNQLTKSKMMAALLKAIQDGLIDLSDKDLIAEARSYTRHDLLETVRDPRLTTRHFDLLIACAIAWQMKEWATFKTIHNYEDYEVADRYSDIGL